MEHTTGYAEPIPNQELTRSASSTARIQDRKTSDARRKAEAEKLKKEVSTSPAYHT
jgi:hypothetical protein